VVGGRYLDIQIDRLKAARYGINVGDIQEIIQTAVGGMAITETVEGLERYTVNVRYDRDFRSDIDSLKRVLVPGAGGRHIPLEQLAASPSIMPRTASKAKTPAAPPGSTWISRVSISAPM
jgi:copper/silver efflux system protein